MNKIIIISLLMLFTSASAAAHTQNKCVTSRAAVASAQRSLTMEREKLAKLEVAISAQSDRDTKRASSLQARYQFADAAVQGALAEANRLGLSCVVLPQPCTTAEEIEARYEVMRSQNRAVSRKQAYTSWIARMKQRSESSATRLARQKTRIENAAAKLADKEEDLKRCLAL